MKKGSGIREELRKVFEIDLDQEREWANVIAIPPTEEERYTAGKAFNDAIPHIEKLTKFYKALQEGLDGICEFGTSAEQNEELRTEMRKYLQNILCYVEFSDFWIRAMNDCSTKENRLKRCKKLTEDFQDFGISVDLEICVMRLKCHSTPEAMQEYLQMYQNELERLEEL